MNEHRHLRSKCGGVRKNWLRRYFVANPHRVVYFEKGGKLGPEGMAKKGEFSLHDASSARISLSPSPQRFEIEVLTASRTYRLAPESAVSEEPH